MKFGSMKKVLAAGLAVVVSAALLAGCGGDQASQKKFLNIGTDVLSAESDIVDFVTKVYKTGATETLGKYINEL